MYLITLNIVQFILQDWQRFKQLETEKREDAHLEKIALGKKLQMSCKTARYFILDYTLSLVLKGLQVHCIAISS